VMEHADGGDLLNKIDKCKITKSYLPESEVWSYFLQAVRGL
jgi:serine/threonine protein kinase